MLIFLCFEENAPYLKMQLLIIRMKGEQSMTKEEMLKKYEDLGVKAETAKVTIEVPLAFVKDFNERGFLAETKIVECFSRVLSEVRLGNVPTIGNYDKEILEMFEIAFAKAEVSEE